MTATEQAFVTVVRWPTGFDEEQKIDAVVRAAAFAGGLGAYDAKLIAARALPSLVLRAEPARAAAMVESLRKSGALAIAPTSAELRCGQLLRAKRLSPAEGAPQPMYLCETWRTEPTGFLTKDITLLVRARINRCERAERKREPTPAIISFNPPVAVPLNLPSSYREEHSTVTDVLDVYLGDGRGIRISGDKFSFDVLGASRGLSDNENMDRLAVKLAEQAPNALVDSKFRSFSSSLGALRGWKQAGWGSGTTIKDEAPTFDFYSAWIREVYQALRRCER